jgi:hypothetical protein
MVRIKNLIESPHKHAYAYQLPKNELPRIIHPGAASNVSTLLPLFIRVISNFQISPSQYYILYDYGKSDIKLNHVMNDFAYLPENPAKAIITQQFYNLDPKSRYNSVYISLNNKGANRHANMLIFDNKTGIAEIYEPYGFLGTNDRYNTQFKNFLIKMQMLLFRKPLKSIKFPVQSCPRFGFQHFNHLNTQRNKKLMKYDKDYKIQGYCAMWCYYLLYLRVSFPKKSIINAQTELILKKREKLPLIIRNFYFKFLQFIRYLNSATKENAMMILDRPKKEDKILTVENIDLCKCSPKNGGFTMAEVKRVAKSYNIYGTFKKTVLCDLIKQKMKIKEVVKSFHQYKHFPPAPMKYNKNMSKCHLSEKQGGYSIRNLRKIGESYSIPHKKRSDICKELRLQFGAHLPPAPMKYNKNISKCHLSEKQGGYSIINLRKIGKSYHIPHKKRTDICRDLKQYYPVKAKPQC